MAKTSFSLASRVPESLTSSHFPWVARPAFPSAFSYTEVTPRIPRAGKKRSGEPGWPRISQCRTPMRPKTQARPRHYEMKSRRYPILAALNQPLKPTETGNEVTGAYSSESHRDNPVGLLFHQRGHSR